MPDAHYEDPPLTALYDLGNGWSVDSDYYLKLAGSGPTRILDIGCGTGILADAFAARGHHVVGADPAEMMLAVARDKPHGTAIRWIKADAQSLDIDETFDLITLTGHAFQTLLSDADIGAAAASIRRHLASDGRAVFESRNPLVNWPARWAYATDLKTPDGVVRETRELVRQEGELMSFDLKYAFPSGETLISKSTLRFAGRRAIEAIFASQGLACDTVHGEWDGSGFLPTESPEMIFHMRHAS